MGGFGSGRQGSQATMESSKRIDVRWLKKKKLLAIPHRGILSWTSGRRDSGKIGYTMHVDRMDLSYRFQGAYDTEWTSVKQTIDFAFTDCNFGGKRTWFSCPNCCRNVAILAGHGVYFYCRKCHRLPYKSNLESNNARISSKKDSLGEQIFEYYKYGDGFIKKKGMHQKTFDRKLKEYRRLESMAVLAMWRSFESLRNRRNKLEKDIK